MKKIIILIVGVFMLIGCKMASTASLPMKVNLKIENSNQVDYTVWFMKEPGTFTEIRPNEKGLFLLDIPMMGGGYKQFLFIRYNVSDPKTYKVVEVRFHRDKKIELSIEDLEKLAEDHDKNRILKLNLDFK